MEGERSHQTDSDREADVDVQEPAKKKRSASEQREWTEMNRWGSNDRTDEENLIFNRRDFDELNTAVLE